MWVKFIFKKVYIFINHILAIFGFSVVKKSELLDFVLFKYKDLNSYRDTQIYLNKIKLNSIWADENTLNSICKILVSHSTSLTSGICHGVRSGFEVNYLNSQLPSVNVIGTDISDTVKNFSNCFVHDFHEIRDDWLSKFDFVYSNSLDQSYNPQLALQTWLNQIHMHGVVIIEHSKGHGPSAVTIGDPFGARAEVMPFLLSDWFGHQISISWEIVTKQNLKINTYLFVIKKNVNQVKILDDKLNIFKET